MLLCVLVIWIVIWTENTILPRLPLTLGKMVFCSCLISGSYSAFLNCTIDTSKLRFAWLCDIVCNGVCRRPNKRFHLISQLRLQQTLLQTLLSAFLQLQWVTSLNYFFDNYRLIVFADLRLKFESQVAKWSNQFIVISGNAKREVAQFLDSCCCVYTTPKKSTAKNPEVEYLQHTSYQYANTT